MVSNPTVVVIGPGAVGCAVAGALLQIGHQVTIVARTRLEKLEITHSLGVFVADVECVTDAAALGPVDVVFLTVKAHQTTSVSPFLAACVGPETSVCILQNGVEHIERVRPFVPASANLVPVIVTFAAQRYSPGRVTVSGPSALVVAADFQGRALERLLSSGSGDGTRDTFVSVRLSDDWLTDAWRKLLLNAVFGGIGALTVGGNEFVRDDGAHALALGLMREVAEVARSVGADISEEFVQNLLASIVAEPGSGMSSIAQDRQQGNPTEWDARNAVIGRVAEQQGIDVPLNRLVTLLIRLGEKSEGTR